MSFLKRVAIIFISLLIPFTVIAQGAEYFERGVAKGKVERALIESQELYEHLQEEVKEGGELNKGFPGLFALGTPPEALRELMKADYEWISYIPKEVTEGGTQELELVEYDQDGNTNGKLDYEIADSSYFAQTAACNRADDPYTHSHTYRALHTPSGFGNRWMPYGSLPGRGLVAPDTKPVRKRMEEVAPRAMGWVSALEKLVPLRCKTLLNVEKECFHSASYRPLLFGELGFASGVCIDIAFKGIDYSANPYFECCPFKVNMTNSVDYLFPTAKLSVSKQQLVSRYLPSQNMRVGEVFPGVVNMLRTNARYFETSSVGRAFEQLQTVMEAAGLKPPPNREIPEEDDDDPRRDPTINEQREPTGYEDEQKRLYEKTDTWYFPWGSWDHPWSRADGRGYFRHILNWFVMNDYRIAPYVPQTYHYPHVWPGWGPEFWPLGRQIYGQSQYFNDFYGSGPIYRSSKGLELSYWLNENQKIDEKRYNEHLREPQKCVRNNVATGKTPADYPLTVCPEKGGQCDEPWTAKRNLPQSADFTEVTCLDNVGDVYPPIAATHEYNSDFILQALAKGLQQYQKLYVTRLNRFSFDRNLDRFHFYPSGNFIEEDPELDNNIVANQEQEPFSREWDGEWPFERDKYAKFRRKRLQQKLDEIYEEKRNELGIGPGSEGEDGEPHPLTKFYEKNPLLQDELNDKMNLDTSDTFQCRLFDEMNTKPAYSYSHLNKNSKEVLGSHAEATAQVFTHFSGCYGYPGQEHWFLDPQGKISGIFRFMPSYWDRRAERLRVR